MIGDSVSIISRGSKTELWVNGKMISGDCIRFQLTQDGGCNPVLEVTNRYYPSTLRAELDSVEVYVEEDSE